MSSMRWKTRIPEENERAEEPYLSPHAINYRGAMQEYGVACLSPRININDEAMREQVLLSRSVRDQQKAIIESRIGMTMSEDSLTTQKVLGLPSPQSAPAGATPTSFANKRKTNLKIFPPESTFDKSYDGNEEHFYVQTAPHDPEVTRLPPISDLDPRIPSQPHTAVGMSLGSIGHANLERHSSRSPSVRTAPTPGLAPHQRHFGFISPSMANDEMEMRKRKRRFISICAEAWDLSHAT